MSEMAFIAEMTMQQAFLFSGAIVLATVVIMNMRRRRPLDGSPKQYRREIDSAVTQSTAVKRDMEQLLVELEKLSRHINAQIDTKFAKLEQSIADADKRISALRILIDEVKRVRCETDLAGGTGESSSGRSSRTTGAQPTDDTQAGASSTTEAPPPQECGVARRSDERYHRIYELADDGRTPVQIAQELGQTVGEVELILNLRGRAGNSAD